MTQIQTLPHADDELPRRRRRRRRHRHHRPRRDRRGAADLADDVKALLRVLDTALRGVERIAWDARHLVEDVTAPFIPEDGDGDGDREGASAATRARRLARTGWMLGQVVASYRLHGLQAAFVSRAHARRMLERTHARNARRFYETSAEQGGAFLKVGQLLSGRSDFMPDPWIEELSKLQDAAPPVGFDQVRAVVEAELGRPVEAIFQHFEPEPMAAASIGQVHRAVLHDGRVVAVKVQRPGIAALVEADMDLLERFVEAMRSSLPDIDHETIVTEIRTALREELDYVREARSTRAMEAFFRTHTDGSVLAPTVVDELSTARVLTMGFIEGHNLARHLETLQTRADAGDDAAHAEVSSLLGRLLEAYLRQVLQGGVFQADPHPGNLMVAIDGRLAVLDYGCTRQLSAAQRDRYLGVVRASLAGDRDRVAELLLEAGFVTRSGRPDTLLAFNEALLGQVATMIEQGQFSLPDPAALRREAARLWSALEDDPVVRMPSDFVMIARVFGGLGGLMSRHAPDIDVQRHVFPVIGEVWMQAS